MRGGCLFMPHSTKPLESGWRQCDFLRLPGRGVHTKRRQERAEYAEGSPASGVELTPHSARNYKGALKVRLHSTTSATTLKRPGARNENRQLIKVPVLPGLNRRAPFAGGACSNPIKIPKGLNGRGPACGEVARLCPIPPVWESVSRQ
jgi:hypothetical protein